MAKEFLGSSVAERMKFIKGFVKDIQDEKRSKGDATELLYALERTLYSEKIKSAKSLKTIMEAEQSARLSGGSIKMLLEHVALVVPVAN